jgi:FkbM family methyltransferase
VDLEINNGNGFEDILGSFCPYIVRKQSNGVSFNYIVADAVAQSWYDTPNGTRISWDDAKRNPIELDRTARSDWREMEILRDHIALPGSKLVECGSHQGLTAILLASWVGPDGFLCTFDAVLLNSLVTRRNLEVNGITNAASYCAAIGGARGIVNLYNDSNVIVRKDAYLSPAGAVMVRLEDVLHGTVDALKLDIEGAELSVLESSAETIRGISRLAIEVHTDLFPPGGFERLVELLGNRPLHILWGDDQFEPYVGQTVDSRVHLFSF